MVKILICICSQDINKLKVTAKSISRLKLTNKENIEILLVDNSKNSQIRNFSNYLNTIKKLRIHYFYFTKKGIPHARNKCLKEAKKIKSNYTCFVDDDSTIPEDWIKNNLNFFKRFENCSIVSGPQNSSNKNIYYDLLKPNHNNLNKISWCATNNVILKSNILRKIKIQFDTRLNNIGGSDQLFFRKLNIIGFEIRWNKKNPIIENYQKDRDNIYWFIKRIFRYSSSSVLIDRYSLGILKGLSVSFIRVIYYFIKFLINLIFIFINPKLYFLKSLNYLIRSISVVLGLLGIFPKRYV